MRANSVALWELHAKRGTRHVGPGAAWEEIKDRCGDFLTRAWAGVWVLLLLGVALGVVAAGAGIIEVPPTATAIDRSPAPTGSDLPAMSEPSMTFHGKDHIYYAP